MGQAQAPEVSFVVPCYNYGRYLGECLGSIFGQQGQHDFEVIAIDDGSTDDTQEILRSFSDSRLKVVFHPHNRGHVATINEGMRLAQGDFIARIDPDDRYRPRFLSLTLEKFRRFPEVALVYGDVALIDERGRMTQGRSDRVHGGQDFKGVELIPLLEENFICSATVIARREAWQSVVPVPEGMAFHDWYFTLRMARRYVFYYIDEVLAEYRVHPLNLHSVIVRNKTEEPSTFRLLDQIFTTPEETRALEEQKQKSKSKVYGAQYRTLAEKYFGFEMHGDARRCYLQAFRRQPRYLFSFPLVRHFLGTLLGPGTYGLFKRLAKAMLPLNRQA